jgi:hypothetical protein
LSRAHTVDGMNEASEPDAEASRSPYLFEQEDVMFSALRERRLRFALVWKAWSHRTIRISSDGILSYLRPNLAKADPLNEKCPKHKMFIMEKIEVTLMADEDMGKSNTDVYEFGVQVKCLTMDRIDTYFRCIMNTKDLDRFLGALKQVAKEHNIDRMPRRELLIKKRSQRFYILRTKQSVMRRAVTHAIDQFDRRSRKERILAKRGAFKSLPVMMANDLIHGSW